MVDHYILTPSMLFALGFVVMTTLLKGLSGVVLAEMLHPV